jgi:hypothetical protein
MSAKTTNLDIVFAKFSLDFCVTGNCIGVIGARPINAPRTRLSNQILQNAQRLA